MLFWAIAIMLSAIVAGVLAVPLLSNSTAGADDREADLQVYRDQLSEIDADLARGVITEKEAEAIRTEVSRRLIAAADAADGGMSAGLYRRAAALLTATVVIGGGLGFYAYNGAPGMPDQPLAPRLAERERAMAQQAREFAERPGQEEFYALLDAGGILPAPPELEPAHAELLDRLRGVLAERPDDLEGHRLLTTNLVRTGQWRAAAAAQAQVVRILGDDATADDLTDLAEFQIIAANGYVSPEAEDALKRALTINPRDKRTRYFAGMTALRAGRPDLTYDLWTRLLSEGPADAPWIPAIQEQIGDVAAAAGRPAPNGPSAADVAAAQDMTSEERQDMIRGMVDGLAERLATEGGPASEWARLIRALGVLQDNDRAREIWIEAQQVFADAPQDLALIREAAREADLTQ